MKPVEGLTVRNCTGYEICLPDGKQVRQPHFKAAGRRGRLLGYTGRQSITHTTGVTENGTFSVSSLKFVPHRAAQRGSDGTCARNGLCHMIALWTLCAITRNGEQKTRLLFTPERNLVCFMTTHYINILKKKNNRHQRLDMDKF